MVSEAELMFQLGAIMLLAFIAATMAGKLNQSVMIGYIIIGAFIGPKVSIEVFGFEYTGLVKDTTFIEVMSQIGLVMLMFFVGLEFSFTKLKRTRTPAIILAVIDTSVGLFVGFLFASYLGWPLIDSIFLAGVIAMSSTSIAMKVLFDLKRMSSPEVEFLIGLVVVETFIAMIILAVASGMIVQPAASPASYGELIIGIAAFYGFFIWMAMWAVPRVVKFFNSIENDELFILFALGIVFLTSGVAAVMNVPPIIGAFFIGMILAETNVTTKIQAKLESFKDAFVAIFFTSFGMLIDVAYFDDIMWMVLLAIPIVLLYEAFVMSSISYFLGFSSKASTTIGTSMSGRGVESILYASVGSQVKGTTMAAQLNPFAGAFCFAMSAITPTLVKHSAGFANVLSRLLPRPLKFSGAIISRTLGKAVLPSSFPLVQGSKATGVLLICFVAAALAVLTTGGMLHVVATLIGALFVGLIFYSVRSDIADIARHVNYTNIGVYSSDKRVIVNLVSVVLLSSIVSVLLIVFSWTYAWQFSLIVLAGYVISVIAAMGLTYRRLYVPGVEGPRKVSHIPRAETESAEPIPALPKPVYGGIRAAPKNSEL